MSMPIRPSVALLALLIAGCGAPHLKTVHSAKSLLVGQEAEVLSRCIGEPMAVETAGGTSSTTLHLYSSAQARGPDGLLLATPKPDADADEWACVFEIRIRDGRILAIHSENRAGWGFGSIKNCSAVVERCVGM